jgi:hypothetical protein
MNLTSGMERFCGSVSFQLDRSPVYRQHFVMPLKAVRDMSLGSCKLFLCILEE